MKPGSNSLPFRGPVLVPTRDEVLRIHELVQDGADVHALSLRAKCEAVLDADPQWREPLK